MPTDQATELRRLADELFVTPRRPARNSIRRFAAAALRAFRIDLLAFRIIKLTDEA